MMATFIGEDQVGQVAECWRAGWVLSKSLIFLEDCPLVHDVGSDVIVDLLFPHAGSDYLRQHHDSYLAFSACSNDHPRVATPGRAVSPFHPNQRAGDEPKSW